MAKTYICQERLYLISVLKVVLVNPIAIGTSIQILSWMNFPIPDLNHQSCHNCQHWSNNCTLGDVDLEIGVLGCAKYGGELSLEALGVHSSEHTDCWSKLALWTKTRRGNEFSEMYALSAMGILTWQERGGIYPWHIARRRVRWSIHAFQRSIINTKRVQVFIIQRVRIWFQNIIGCHNW